MSIKYDLTKSIQQNLENLLVDAGYPRSELDKVTFGEATVHAGGPADPNSQIKVTLKKELADKINLTGLTTEALGEDTVITHKFMRLDFLDVLGNKLDTPHLIEESYESSVGTANVVNDYLTAKQLGSFYDVTPTQATISYEVTSVAELDPKLEPGKVALQSHFFAQMKLDLSKVERLTVPKLKLFSTPTGNIDNSANTQSPVAGNYSITPVTVGDIRDLNTFLREEFNGLYRESRRHYLDNVYPDTVSGNANPKLQFKELLKVSDGSIHSYFSEAALGSSSEERVFALYNNAEASNRNLYPNIIGTTHKLVELVNISKFPAEMHAEFGASKRLDFVAEGYNTELTFVGTGTQIQTLKITGASITDQSTAQAAIEAVVAKLNLETDINEYVEVDTDPNLPVYDTSSVIRVYKVKSAYERFAFGHFAIVADYPASTIETTERLNGFSGIEGV